MSDDPDWERIAREHIGRELEHEGHELYKRVGKVAYTVRPGGVLSREEIVNFRAQLLVVRDIVEDDVAPLVDGVTPWGDPSYIKSDGYAADYLDLTMAQVNEVNVGATADVTASDRRELAETGRVDVETESGITVMLRAAQAADVEPGP